MSLLSFDVTGCILMCMWVVGVGVSVGVVLAAKKADFKQCE